MEATTFHRRLMAIISFFSLAFILPQSTASENIVENLISQMTLEEKISLLGGTGFGTKEIPRLKIPALKMADGPMGVRGAPATSFPSGISMGATFNPELVQQVAAAIAEETLFFGKNYLLGPTVNLSRHPFGGRNFESFGEDPYLSGELATKYVTGIQSRKVLASVKHFALNEQEYDRHNIDVYADTRTMMELHFPPFKKAIDAGAWSVMASYNKVNGLHATENSWLLTTLLKNYWNFQGFVVSDWAATYSTVHAANAGLDLEMPFGTHFDGKLFQAVKEEKVREELINDKVRRLLRAMNGIDLLQNENPRSKFAVGPESLVHQNLALQAAQESLVLLKNENQILPLKGKRIAVMGPNAIHARTGGGGSSFVHPYYQVSPHQGLQNRSQGNFDFVYTPGQIFEGDFLGIETKYFRPDLDSERTGLRGEYFSNPYFEGEADLVLIDKTIDHDFKNVPANLFQENFSIRWTGFLTPPVSGKYKIKMRYDDGIRILLDGKIVFESSSMRGTAYETLDLNLIGGKIYSFQLDYHQKLFGAYVRLGWELPRENEHHLAEALRIAKESDTVLIFAGLNSDLESEGFDRATMDLPDGQSELIQKVSEVNPNVVVVINAGNPVTLDPWIHNVKGLVYAWYPGQEGGNALADVLLGNVNPSGKLPITLMKTWKDSPAFGNYPGQNGIVEYKEGLFLGYRHYDQKNLDVHYPFGFGLSYTHFRYSDLKISQKNQKISIEFQVQNTGKVAGHDVPQLYLGQLKSSVVRPVRELKGFQKIFLIPGEIKNVIFELDRSAFQYFDAEKMKWVVDPHLNSKIWIGSSSREIHLSESLNPVF